MRPLAGEPQLGARPAAHAPAARRPLALVGGAVHGQVVELLAPNGVRFVYDETGRITSKEVLRQAATIERVTPFIR